MSSPTLHIRLAKKDDLAHVNHVIEAAIMTWNLPERVKRLSLPSYRYTDLDFKHIDMAVAEKDEHNIVGVAAWEEADPKDIPDGQTAMLLHGIYVAPRYHHQGIGQQLFEYVETSLQSQYDGLLVKAQEEADGFFLIQGMQRIPVKNKKQDYVNRFWKHLGH